MSRNLVPRRARESAVSLPPEDGTPLRRSELLDHIEAGHGPRVAAAPALDLQRTLEADEIGGAADVLGGHPAVICQ